MKKLFTLALIIVFCGQLSAQSKATKKTIATLQNGENIVYGENCFKLKGANQKTVFVTSKSDNGNTKYFVYTNGVKKGPISQLTKDIYDCDNNGVFVEKNCASYASQEIPYDDFNKYVVIDQNTGQASIKFNNKSYGPYTTVSQFELSADKKKFYAVVMPMGTMKTMFISSDNKSLEYAGNAEKILVSPDGSDAWIFVRGTLSLESFQNGETIQINENTFKEMNNVYLINIGGKKLGPFENKDGNGLSTYDVWYCKTNNNLLYKMKDDIYMNGVKFKTIPNFEGICYFWLSPDGKRIVTSNYEKITFEDGESFKAPLEIDYIIENGKTYLIWVSLENETNMVQYKKEL